MIEENKTLSLDIKKHWDNVYENSRIDKLGWYEDVPEPSLRLINQCDFKKEAILLNIGAGATTLIDELLKLGYKNIIANDLSSTGLNKLKERIGDESDKVIWIVDDLTHPKQLNNIGKIDLWHDRAVLHFLTDQKDQNVYFKLLKRLLKKNGFVILAAFNLEGATKCSGLPVHRYNENMLQEKLGNDFKLLKAFDYSYQMPSGDRREYVYTLFKRKR